MIEGVQSIGNAAFNCMTICSASGSHNLPTLLVIMHNVDMSDKWHEEIAAQETCFGNHAWDEDGGSIFFPNAKQMMSCYSYSYSYWPMKWVSWMLDVHTQKEAKPSWLWHSEQCSGRQNYFCIPSPKLVPRVDRGWLYGIILKTNVFNFTLFFSSASLFSLYDILQVPINLGSRTSTFFCKIYHV